MGKITAQDRNLYYEKTLPYKSTINDLLKQEQEKLAAIGTESPEASLKRIALGEDMLDLASWYIALSNMCRDVLSLRDEEALNEARKSLYRGMEYLESVVTNLVDASFSEYEEGLAGISSLKEAERYRLIRKLGLTIQLLEDAYGDNFKWKWSFVEMEGRMAVITKNILDLKAAEANRDPRSPDYEPTMYHLILLKKLLNQAADRYREKYELSTRRIDDFQMAIRFLGALRMIHILLGDREDAENVKRKFDVWTARMQADQRKIADA
jgi:hypothetical protein